MNAISASHGLWLRILIPVNFGAFFRKLGSELDHWSYSAVTVVIQISKEIGVILRQLYTCCNCIIFQEHEIDDMF